MLRFIHSCDYRPGDKSKAQDGQRDEHNVFPVQAAGAVLLPVEFDHAVSWFTHFETNEIILKKKVFD